MEYIEVQTQRSRSASPDLTVNERQAKCAALEVSWRQQYHNERIRREMDNMRSRLRQRLDNAERKFASACEVRPNYGYDDVSVSTEAPVDCGTRSRVSFGSSYRSPDRGTHVASSPRQDRYLANGNRQVPLPKQIMFDGSNSWESFIIPFESLAKACGWNDSECLFRLTSSLRGDAAEYAFGQLPPEAASSFDALKCALETRFKERRPPTSYLAELEATTLQSSEDTSVYIASLRRLVIKAYPTADEVTRETIVLRHFLRGLPDQNTAVAVGMSGPKTVDDARVALEIYSSLRDDAPRFTSVRQVTASNDEVHSESDINKLTKQLDTLFSEYSRSNEGDVSDVQLDRASPRRDKKTVECYRCHEFGHYASECQEVKNIMTKHSEDSENDTKN